MVGQLAIFRLAPFRCKLYMKQLDQLKALHELDARHQIRLVVLYAESSIKDKSCNSIKIFI